MADIKNTTAFKALAAQVTADLLTRGLDLEPVAVHNVLAHMVDTLVQQMGITPQSALRYVDPAVVADQITAATAPGTPGSEHVQSARPVRPDDRTVPASYQDCGRQIMALAQAAKYATENQDPRTTTHALDLLTELGAALYAQATTDEVPVPVGVLYETADILETVTAHIHTDAWSICPCGEDHGQKDVDTQVSIRMADDARHARTLRTGPES